jgi:transmembrane sensor
MHQPSHYRHYTSEDFATNESFQAFVYRTDADEVQFWENFIRQYPEKQHDIDEAIELVSLLAPGKTATSDQHKNRELERLLATIRETENQNDTPTIPLWSDTSERPWFHRWRGLAASLTGLLLLAAGGYFYLNQANNDPIILQTAYGENATFTLPDSSVVTLNGNTKLRHAPNWDGQHNREVWVDGEAFFDVKHKVNNARFVVHTPDLDVEVLGTRFNVFNRNDKTNVVLNSGKVKVNIMSEKDTNRVMMVPGETVEYFRKNKKVVKNQVNAEALTSWRNKVLVFENTPLYKVGEMIEDTYGVDVIFKENVKANQKLVGTIPSDNLDVLLTVLAKSSNLRISRNNNQVVIENSLPLSDHP